MVNLLWWKITSNTIIEITASMQRIKVNKINSFRASNLSMTYIVYIFLVGTAFELSGRDSFRGQSLRMVRIVYIVWQGQFQHDLKVIGKRVQLLGDLGQKQVFSFALVSNGDRHFRLDDGHQAM